MRTVEPLLPAPGEPRALRESLWRRRVVFAVLFLVATIIGRSVQVDGGNLAIFWPAAAVGLLWLSRAPGRLNRIIDALLLAGLSGGVRVVAGTPVSASLLLAVAAAVQASAGAWTYRGLQAVMQLSTPAHLRTLALASAAGAFGSLPFALFGFHLMADVSPLLLGVQWVLRTTVSTFVVLAVVLRMAERRPDAPGAAATRTERMALLLVCLALYWVAFWWLPGVAIAFTVLPVAVWTALRCTTTAATVHVVLSASMVDASTWAGRGPWVALPPTEQALAAAAFIGTLGLVTLVLALFRDENVANARRAETAHADAAAQADLLNVVFGSISDAVCVFREDGSRLLRNSAAEVLLGALPDSPSHWRDGDQGFRYPDGTRIAEADLPIARALAGESVVDVDMLLATPTMPKGCLVTVSAHPLPKERGASWSGGVVAAFHDVSQVRRAAAEVADAHDLLLNVLDAATEHSIIAVNPSGVITVFNEGAQRMLGHHPEEMLGRDVSVVHDPDEVSYLDADLRSQGPATEQRTYVRRDGSTLQVSLTTSPIRDSAGELIGFIEMATDITARLAAERELESSEELFRVAFDKAPIGTVMVSLTGTDAGKVLRVNRSMKRFTGRAEDELVGSMFLGLVTVDCVEEVSAAIAGVLDVPGGELSLECSFEHADGRVLEGEVAGTVVHPGGEPALLCLVEDVTARKSAERQLIQQALHDPLTGLPNRTLFTDRLAHAVAAACRDGGRVGLLYIDLDGFKAVNDTAGHAAGDQLLVEVSAILRQCVRPGDTVARLGGDEFAIVCPQVSGDPDLVTIGRRVLAALREPITLDGSRAEIGASIGVRSCTEGDTPEQLLRDADGAIYRAKRAGKGRIVVHEGTGTGTHHPVGAGVG
ncbi:MAG: diguanylate cyclase domain-containing protein [Janthinobacterium lividum]